MNNKLKIGKWRVVLLFLAVLFLAGCSQEDDGIGNNTDDNGIVFDCSASNLRATKTTAEDMQYFRVSAVWDKDGVNYESFMNNQLVEKQGDNWVYSPIKYWPGYGSVSFFAYTPATSSGIELLHLDTVSNQISIIYSVRPNYKQQEDFMVATDLDRTANPIQLNFEHALSAVNFQARSNEAGVTLRIKEIKLTNLYSEGIITGVDTGGASTWMWYNSTEPTDYIVYQKYPFETQDNSYGEVGSLMVLPQEPPGNFAITLSYDIVIAGISESRTTEYTLDSDFTFDMGKRYTFYLEPDTQSSTRVSEQGISMPEIRYHIVSEPYEE